MITVLRLGHRRIRDARISTHVGLVARAFGTEKIIYSGEKDQSLIDSLDKVSENWGGKFKISYEKNWRKIIKNFRGKKIHLTMYGLPIQDEINKIRRNKNLLVVVGGEKVPGEVYSLVDYNVAVSNQPHSEVAALAVFLHEYFRGKELQKSFGGKFRIIPQKTGKKLIH